MKNIPEWLEKAVFYEIYPQTFYDSNGDGIGDLNGIRQKLDYLLSLGITAVWLNPCFESPFMDAGYDVSDYYKVAPRYGTNDDLRLLFAEARLSGIRILLDLVPGHTSIEHPWFKASCRHERNQYSDYYIWTDSVWAWNAPNLGVVNGFAGRNGNYITNFFYFQPALNYGFARPDPAYPWQQSVEAPGPQRVRQEMKDVMRFWLDMGASGFRVDMAGSLVKGDIGQAECIRLWNEMRLWLDHAYPQACLVSEWSNPSVAIQAGFHLDFMIHFGTRGYNSLFRKSSGAGPGVDPYGFSFFDPSGHGNIREFLDSYLKHYHNTRQDGLIAIPTGNHDIHPRWSMGRTTADLKVASLFILSMPGTPFIYYGDEIGMRSLDGLPSKEGGYDRTGVRTPMQWAEGPNAGFSRASQGQLYLPVDDSPNRPTVAAQEGDLDSLLNWVRALVCLRQAHPALCATGSFEPVYAEAGQCPFIYLRQKGDEKIIVALNPSGQAVEVTLAPELSTQAPDRLFGADKVFVKVPDGWRLRLPSISGGVYQVV